jgi:hypothetical protein
MLTSLSRGFPGAGRTASTVQSDPPAAWTMMLDDPFSQAATTGQSAISSTIWKHTGYGTGTTSGGAARWDNAACLESTGTTLRLHAKKVGTEWHVAGFQQGAQNVDPTAYGYHPGYLEFHTRVRARFSSLLMPGAGGYALMWPVNGLNNVWSSEIDIFETPGRNKNSSLSVIHWDSRSATAGNLGGNNQQSYITKTADLSSYHTWDCRRTISYDSAGVPMATIRIWLDGVELLGDANWTNNKYLCYRMVPGLASYIADPSWAQYTQPSSETPLDNYLEVDRIQVWAPAEAATPKALTLSPSAPGTLVRASAGASVSWSTTVAKTGAITTLSYAVFNADNTTVGTPTTVSMPNATLAINVTFTTTGQYFQAWENGNGNNVFVKSQAVTITEPTQSRSLSLSPNTLGSRVAGTVPVTVTTTGVSSITFVVVNSDNSWVGPGEAKTTTGSIIIYPNFTKTGQYLKVFATNDTTLVKNTTAITIKPNFKITSLHGSCVIESQDGVNATVRFILPVYSFTEMFKVERVNAPATATVTNTYWGNNPGNYLAVQNGNFAVNRTLTTSDNADYNTAIFQNLSDGSTIQLAIKLTVSPDATGVAPAPVAPPDPQTVTFFEGFPAGRGTGALQTRFIAAGTGNSLTTSADGIVDVVGNVSAMTLVSPTKTNDGKYGFGNGLFEMRVKFNTTIIGDGSGPALILWPADDVWPGSEIDLGEFQPNGTAVHIYYMATHWKDANGANQSTTYPAKAPFDATQWFTVKAYLQTDKITYYINDTLQYVDTAHPAPDYAHGGTNHSIGFLNNSSNTSYRVNWVRWTPEASIIANGFPAPPSGQTEN